MGGSSRRRSPLGLVRPDRDCQARRSYAVAVNEMSAAMTSSLSRVRRLRAARLWVGDGCSRTPPRGAKSPGLSVAQPGLEPRAAFHVSQSGVAERRCTVPILGGLLD
jgi:hypothetical protein